MTTFVDSQVEDALERKLLLSGDLVSTIGTHAEDEEEVFFEVIVDETVRKAMRHSSRIRLLEQAWKDNESDLLTQLKVQLQ